jgi:hypothetical protein
MHIPIAAILESLRCRLGLGNLSDNHDRELEMLSLMRNCFVHNAGKADLKLAAANSSVVVGQSIEVGTETLEAPSTHSASFAHFWIGNWSR